VPDGYIGQRRHGLRNRLLTQGRGTYVADVELEGMLHMAVLRSPYASARIRSIDTTAAAELPGVRYVVTGEEIREHTEPIPEGWDTSTINANGVAWYALCVDRVRYVGEAVAAVVAESRYQAQLALAAIEVDYDPLPQVTDPVAALEPGAPLVEPEWGSNLRVARDLAAGDLEAAMLAADGVVSGSLTTGRTTGVPIEPRGMVASWDADEEQLTLWASTQNPHPLRLYLSQTIGLKESRIRVIQPQVGGAFGLKQPTFQEEPLIAYLALRLRRPIRWIEERDENFLCTGHARDMRVSYRACYLADGTVTGLEVDILADVGAPTSLVGWGMSVSASGILPGPYRIPNRRVRLQTVVTNKGPWNSYRGFGRDAANWWLERIMDQVADTLGLGRAEVRFRNLIGPDEFPFPRDGGGIIDSGDYPTCMRRVMELIGWDGFAAERARARERGRFIGIGVGNELGSEGCAMPGSPMISAFDGATVRMTPSGEVTVLSGVTSPGSGNETGLAQIVADTIGCELDRVTVVQGDTQVCPWGLGNYSSRSIIIGGSAAGLAATDLRDKLLTVAGNLLEANPEDLAIGRGRVAVRGAPRRYVSLADVAMEIYTRPYGPNADGVEPGLESTRYFRAPNIYHQPATQGRFSAYPTWPSATAACVVEVDPDTGIVHILRHVVVDDSGTVVNPTLVEANLHGATAQAFGGGMFERIAYDETGQLQTATLMDYTIPTAVEMPMITVAHHHSPSPFTPLGTKGAGESGMGSALGALTSAIENALPHLELRLTELPLTPSRLWHAIRSARPAQGAAATPAAGAAAHGREPVWR
jgi:carbon-monoxide dehydrogenase large subunit